MALKNKSSTIIRVRKLAAINVFTTDCRVAGRFSAEANGDRRRPAAVTVRSCVGTVIHSVLRLPDRRGDAFAQSSSKLFCIHCVSQRVTDSLRAFFFFSVQRLKCGMAHAARQLHDLP